MSTYTCWNWETDEAPDSGSRYHDVEACDPEFAATEWAEAACQRRCEYTEVCDEGLHVAVRDDAGVITHWRVHAEQALDYSANAWDGPINE